MLYILEAEDMYYMYSILQADLSHLVVDDDIPDNIYHLSTQLIVQEQKKDVQLLELLRSNPSYFHKKVEHANLIH